MGKIKKYLIFINFLDKKTYSGIDNDFNIHKAGNDVLEIAEKIVKIFPKAENIPKSIDHILSKKIFL